MTHLGFIGTGRMGGPMATRLLDAGHPVTVFDRSEAALAPIVARGAQPAVPMIVGSAVGQVLAITSARHGPQSDFTAMVKTVEGWAGVEVGG